jgi:hypothetical protein
MLSKSERYRKAAEACRKTAETSATPLEWLRFAADWDSMATQDEKLAARETKVMVECLIADTAESLALHWSAVIGPKPIVSHRPLSQPVASAATLTPPPTHAAP